MCEDYNSPQSPYWCLKTLIAIALEENDHFWADVEAPYPKFDPPCALVPTPKQILCNHPRGNHHFLLSPAQFVAWPMKATQAKYSKFAYSSAFAFSVPTGPLVQQIAPDSTLAISRDGGESWAVKWKLCDEASFSTANLRLKDSSEISPIIPIARVRWYPWGDRSVSIETTLVPPTDRWPDWHVRIHRIRVSSNAATPGGPSSPSTLRISEGGFAISDRRKVDAKPVPTLDVIPGGAELGVTEGIFADGNAVVVCSSVGASGVVARKVAKDGVATSCAPLKPDSNTNLVSQRTLIPVVKTDMPWPPPGGDEITLVTIVFAISSEANGGWNPSGRGLKQRWQDTPRIILHGEEDSGEDAVVVP
jgi:hypothetical protein